MTSRHKGCSKSLGNIFENKVKSKNNNSLKHILAKCNSIETSLYNGSDNISAELPKPVTSFGDLRTNYGFDHNVLENTASMQYNLPSAVQSSSIPILHKQFHLVACAPTGTGKTAAFLLPIINQLASENISGIQTDYKPSDKISPMALILAPTQELLRQIWADALRLSTGIAKPGQIVVLSRKHYANRGKLRNKGATSKNAYIKERCLPKLTKIIVATPQRASFLFSLPPKDTPFDLKSLSWLVIDECDKMLESDFYTQLINKDIKNEMKSGHHIKSFHDQLKPLIGSISSLLIKKHGLRRLTVALFSATIPTEVLDWAKYELVDKPLKITHDSDRSTTSNITDFMLVHLQVGLKDASASTVRQELKYCATEQGKLLELRCMLARGMQYPCLIFLDSRKRAMEVFKEILLSDADILANFISSEKTESQREAIVRSFREGKINILICTNLLARGIDFKGVAMVINYDLPTCADDYIHRVGRTGRAGQLGGWGANRIGFGHAISLWTNADLPYLAPIIVCLRHSGAAACSETELVRLESLVDSWKARRQASILSGRTNAKYGQIMQTRRFNRPTQVNPQDFVISTRRRERRLAVALQKQNRKRKYSEERQSFSTAHIRFRPWNPQRGSITEVPGSLTGRIKRSKIIE